MDNFEPLRSNIEMDFEPKIYRTLIFIRHGQYELNPEKLTKVGREQAALVARAIQPFHPSKVYCSTMPRAIETASFLSKTTKKKPIERDFFREGRLPGTVEYHRTLMKNLSPSQKSDRQKKFKEAKQSADAAFKFLFQPPKKGQSCEVIVAHGNVIRHWVCKALKIDEKKWLNMDVMHASITTIRVDHRGHIVLLGFSDVGHLPHNLRTYV